MEAILGAAFLPHPTSLTLIQKRSPPFFFIKKRVKYGKKLFEVDGEVISANHNPGNHPEVGKTGIK